MNADESNMDYENDEFLHPYPDEPSPPKTPSPSRPIPIPHSKKPTTATNQQKTQRPQHNHNHNHSHNNNNNNNIASPRLEVGGVGANQRDNPFLFREDPNERIHRGHFSNEQLEAGSGMGAGNSLDDKVLPTFVNFDPDEEDWEAVQEEPHNASDDDHCVDCDLDQTLEEGETNPFVEQYRQHYQDNLMYVSRPRLSKQVQKLYNMKVKKNTDAKRIYTARNISRHFEQHAPTPAVLNAIDFRMYNKSMQILRKNKIFKKDTDTGTEDVDTAALRLYQQLAKARNDVQRQLFPKKRQVGGGGSSKNTNDAT